MSLFRRHKKFEDQLREQLGDSEYKPSESLWDRIDSGIAEDGFETGVQRSLENFEQVPYPETWEKIAAELPEERVGNRFLRYYGVGFLALLVFLGTYAGYRLSQQPVANDEKPNTTITFNSNADGQIVSGETSASVSSDATINTSEGPVTSNNNTGNNTGATGQVPGNLVQSHESTGNRFALTGKETHPVVASDIPVVRQANTPASQGSVATDRVANAQAKATVSVAHTNTQPGKVTRQASKASQTVETDGHVVSRAAGNTAIATPSTRHRQGSARPRPQADTRVIRRGSAATAAAPQRIIRGNQEVASATAPPAISDAAQETSGSAQPARENHTIIASQPVQQPAQNSIATTGSVTPENHTANTQGETSNPATSGTEQGNASGSSATFSDPATGGATPQPSVQAVAIENKPLAEQVILQENVRVLTEAAPDSTVKAYQPLSEDEKLSPVSISIVTGANMCYTTYAAPENYASSFEKNIALRKKLERPDVDWSGLFLLDIRLTERWMLSSGVGMVNFSQKFDYNTTPAVNPGKHNEAGAIVTNPGDSVISGSTYTNRIKYSWTEIPLLINYTIVKKHRFNVDLQTGISYAFINTVDAGIVAYDNKGVLSVKNTEAFPQISSTIFVSVLPQISYKFNEQLSLGIIPSFKYSLTSIIGDERWVQQHPYFIGANICLRKRF